LGRDPQVGKTLSLFQRKKCPNELRTQADRHQGNDSERVPHSTSEAINAGLDIDMPNGGYFNQQTIHAAIAAKNVSVEQLHNSCLRIMRGWYALPEAKRLPCGGGICIDNNVSTPAHKQLARKLSAMSTVLLKNEGGLLPLSKQAQLKIALIGADASAPYVPTIQCFSFVKSKRR
jgi:beta-glucosidase-like glycosyl hydrolase